MRVGCLRDVITRDAPPASCSAMSMPDDTPAAVMILPA